ncbi:MAG: ECF transporter S component [Lachnospiraceae bacterium]|nr:ECF transporter S component [Lachnospiraceae bacterium]
MKLLSSTRILVAAALLSALVFISTTVIKIPTPTFGYIHIGDGFVLLSGLLLGPVAGGLAAGFGSALSDIIGGYASWAPATFMIKFLTAATASLLFSLLTKNRETKTKRLYLLLPSVAAELVMTLGYFLYNIIFLSFINTGSERTALASAVTLSAAEIPFNLMQALFGMIILLLCYPILSRVSERYMISRH